jgi:hypothetical protein
MEAAQGRAPCPYCAAVNAPPVNAPAVNPYGPQAFGQVAPSGGQGKVCPTCRLDNPLDNTVCSGCATLLPLTPWQAAARGPMASGDSRPAAHPWTCRACRKENQGHYEFCLGCGGARPSGGGHVERNNGYDGNPVESRQRSPVVLIAVVIATLAVVAALVGVAVLVLAR